ncbi:hypothetical protein Y699_05369 [Aspergillus fumigatus Z5]|nr:hypothetical protein Y699_05369 [Aspergillus fumigatus Z5]
MSTVSEMFLVMLLLAANCLLLTVSARHWGDIQRCAANLAVSNLIPLCIGLSFGRPTDLLGINRSSFACMPRWFGRMAVAHSLLHGGSIIVRADELILSLRRSRIALLAAASVISIIPVTLHPIVQRHSQVAMKIHYLLAITAMAALSYHTQDRRSNCRSYLVAAGVLCVVLSVASGVHSIIKKRWGYAWPTVTLRPFHELLP